MASNYKIAGLIHSAYNDVIKSIKDDFGWDLGYIKCNVVPIKGEQAKLVGNVLRVNPYFKKFLSDNNLIFDNLKKFFVLTILREICKELYNNVWDDILKKKMLKTIKDQDKDVTEEDTLLDYFSILVYSTMLGRLNQYGKEHPVD